MLNKLPHRKRKRKKNPVTHSLMVPTLTVLTLVHLRCSHLFTYGVHTHSLTVFTLIHLWCSHSFTYGAHTYLLMVFTLINLRCSHSFTYSAHTYGAHTRSLTVLILIDLQCSHPFTYGAHTYSLMELLSHSWVFLSVSQATMRAETLLKLINWERFSTHGYKHSHMLHS